MISVAKIRACFVEAMKSRGITDKLVSMLSLSEWEIYVDKAIEGMKIS